MFTGLAGSAYNAILSQYSDSNGPVNNDVVLAGTWVDSATPPNPVNDQAIVAEIVRARAQNPAWPTNNDTQYIVFPQSGSTISGSGFCAYHNYGTGSDNVVYRYALIPYLGDSAFGACQTPSESLANRTTEVTTHEYAETATDPLLGSWRTTDLYEIGDLCNAQASGGPQFSTEPGFGVDVQQLWDNATSRCVTYNASAYAKAVIADHPALYYRFGEDNDNQANDSAGNLDGQGHTVFHNGTYPGGVFPSRVASAIPADTHDTALSDPGGQSIVNYLGGNGLPSGNSARSVELWYKSSGNSPLSLFWYGSQATDQAFEVNFDGTNPTTTFAIGAYADVVLCKAPSGNIQDGNWHQLVVTYDGSYLRCYLDGSQIDGAKQFHGSLNTTASNFQLGYIPWWNYTFSGSLDELAIYNTALTATQVSAHFNQSGSTPGAPASVNAVGGQNQATVSWTPGSAGNSPITGYVVTAYLNGGTTASNSVAVNGSARSVTLYGLQGLTNYTFTVHAVNSYGLGPDAYSPLVSTTGSLTTYASTIRGDNPVAYYRLGDPSGAIAADSSGNGRTASYQSSATLGAAGAINDPDTAVTSTGAGPFATSNGVGLPSGNSARSVELWYKSSGNSPLSLFSYGSAATDQAFEVNFDTTNPTTTFAVGAYADVVLCRAPSGNIQDGNWHQLVVTYDGSYLRCYLDGSQIDGAKQFLASLNTTAANFQLGSVPWWSYNFNGTMDDVAIYGVALTASQVAAHWHGAGH